MTKLVYVPAILALTLLAACGDAAKTKWPTGRTADDGNFDPTVFSSKSCLQNLRVTAFEKSGQRPITLSRDVYVCAFAAETASAETKTSAMPYGDDYESVAIKPSYFIESRNAPSSGQAELEDSDSGSGAAKLSTARSDRDLVVRLRLSLPEDTPKQVASDIKAAIADCSKKIHAAWIKNESKIGLRIDVPVTVIGDEESSKSRAFNQRLEMIKSLDGKANTYALAIWPFHSEFKIKGDTEPLCRSLAKLSAHWVGLPDSAAPATEGVACKGDETLVSHPSGNSLVGGFNKSEYADETEDSNFWSKLLVREDRELKTILQSQCQKATSRPTSRPNVRRKSNPPPAASDTSAAAAPQLDSSVEDAE